MSAASRAGTFEYAVVAGFAAMTLASVLPPQACVLLIAAVYSSAIALTLAGLFNWQLWVWLLEVTAMLWYLLRRDEPSSAMLLALLWSALVFFCVGLTLVLRRGMRESSALGIALMCAILQFGLLIPLSEWIALLCGAGGHPCACGS